MKCRWIGRCVIALALMIPGLVPAQEPAETPGAVQPAPQAPTPPGSDAQDPVEQVPVPQEGSAAPEAGGADQPQPAEEAAEQPATIETAAQQQAVAPEPQQTSAPTTVPTNLQGASLVQVIDALCRQLQLNYILDPRVEGSVILNTYGPVQEIDTRSLLDLILRVNGAAIVQVGDIYRILPLTEVPRVPLRPQVNAVEFPEDDQLMLNLIFLKYATVSEISELLTPFLGEGAGTWAYSPANLLLILDSRRNMRRLMDLVALFDSDTLAGERVRLFDVENGRPSDIVVELEKILQSISLGEQASPIRFLPVDRLNLIIGVAPNPGAFDEVEKWLRRLDQPVKLTVGSVNNYVYRVKYGRSEMLAAAIMELYGGGGYGYGGYGYGSGLFSGRASVLGNRYGSSFGYGGMGGAYGSGGGYGGMYGGGAYGSGAYGSGMYGGGAYGGGMYGGGIAGAGALQQQAGAAVGTGGDQTGTYLSGGYGGWRPGMPRVVPTMDNSLLIQASPQEYQQILNLLDQLDVPPRQVLIEARIYEVRLTGAFSAGVQAYLAREGQGGEDVPSLATRALTGSATSGGLSLSAGALVDKSRELLLGLQAMENNTNVKVVSAPNIIATDSIPAGITIGSEVPTLTGQAVSPIQSGGTSLFTNSIANRDSGVTLGILAQVSPSGIVTMIIDQEISSPQPPSVGGIQSPSFSKRTVQTQVTVADGDTIAIGGVITESSTQSSAGVPFLHRIPILGYAFGGKSQDHERTELIVFLTPRVIYDMNQVAEATDELKSRFRKLNRLLKNEE